MAQGEKISYWNYIKVADLLSLQSGTAEDESDLTDDEVRFIVIHQIDELWFKLVIRELETIRNLFLLPFVPETALAKTCAAMERVSLTFDLAASHFRLMETMRTQDYLTFRDKLSPASGFQSAQMREMEILLGLQPEERISLGYEGSFMDALKGDEKTSSAFEQVKQRIEENTSVKQAIYDWLYRTPINGSSPESANDKRVVQDFLDECYTCEANAKKYLIDSTAVAQALAKGDIERLRKRYKTELQSSKTYLDASDIEDPTERPKMLRLRAAILFIESNRELPLLSWPGEIIDGMIKLEQSMAIFRQRHARMVERVIGRRVGTGGSAGVDYLDQTGLKYRVFSEIWSARTMLLAPHQAPSVKHRDYYGLRAD
jgi:tryptophan 2,3-dioxygenase